jgi:glycosyltransferase involved in cell wall biosynthesis
MNFEKPVIVSTTCGSYYDLVKYGENGYSFEEGDIGELKSCIEKTLEDPIFLTKAGKVSAALVKDFSIEKIAANIVAAAGNS